MNILILNWRDPKNPKSGGAEIVTLEHARAWVNAGHTVEWFTSRFAGAPQREIIDGVTIIRKGGSLTNFFYAPFFYLSRKNNYDVVVDEIHGLPYFTPLYVKEPIIAFIHEVAGEIWDYMYPFPINKIGKFIESRYFHLYKVIPFWTDAPSTIDDLSKYGIARENCVAIPCPISNNSQQLSFVKEKKPTFIFVSRLVKMKGVEDVIKAFKEIVVIESKAKLWIVGGGEENYVVFLKSLVKKLGLEKQVRFYGKVTDAKKKELMRKAHLLLHASVKEGWGLVVVEAASQMTPSVVYNVSGLKDSVKDQQTGILTKENTPEALAEAAISLINDKTNYQRLQKNAVAWATSLTWEDATQKSLKLLESL